jgi:hypothetical protein
MPSATTSSEPSHSTSHASRTLGGTRLSGRNNKPLTHDFSESQVAPPVRSAQYNS